LNQHITVSFDQCSIHNALTIYQLQILHYKIPAFVKVTNFKIFKATHWLGWTKTPAKPTGWVGGRLDFCPEQCSHSICWTWKINLLCKWRL